MLPIQLFPFSTIDIANERKSGMAMGLELLDRCDELWAFGPLISDGMKKEIEHARRKDIPIRYLSESLEEE